MNRRLVVATLAGAGVLGFVVPSFAQTVPSVTVNTHNGVSVGVQNGAQPVGAVSVTPDGQVCAGISLQVTHCVGGGAVQSPSLPKLP